MPDLDTRRPFKGLVDVFVPFRDGGCPPVGVQRLPSQSSLQSGPVSFACRAPLLRA
jgi:hypothetical protein